MLWYIVDCTNHCNILRKRNWYNQGEESYAIASLSFICFSTLYIDALELHFSCPNPSVIRPSKMFTTKHLWQGIFWPSSPILQVSLSQSSSRCHRSRNRWRHYDCHHVTNSIMFLEKVHHLRRTEWRIKSKVELCKKTKGATIWWTRFLYPN